MKEILAVLLTAGFVACSVQAQVTPADSAKKAALTPEESAQYATLSRTEVELSAQVKLLTALSEEHLKRSADAKAGGQEKAKWETELAQELRSQSATLLAQLNEAARRRAAFEAAHTPPPSPGFGVGALEEGKGLTGYELLYATRLDERLLKVRQELAASLEAEKNIYAQLQTNTTAEAVTKVSELLQENGRQVKQWERDQAELELKKLEFQAIRK